MNMRRNLENGTLLGAVLHVLWSSRQTEVSKYSAFDQYHSNSNIPGIVLELMMEFSAHDARIRGRSRRWRWR